METFVGKLQRHAIHHSGDGSTEDIALAWQKRTYQIHAPLETNRGDDQAVTAARPS